VNDDSKAPVERERDLLHQVEEQYLRNLQEHFLDNGRSFDKVSAVPADEYKVTDSSNASAKKNSGAVDSELLRTIRQLEQFHVESDERYLNGEEEKFGLERPEHTAAPEPPSRETKQDTVKEEPKPPPESEKKPLEITTSTYEPGTILKLENGSVGVFKESLPDKEYDVIYYLLPDGKIEPRGVSLFSYSSERIGKLPNEYFSRMESLMRWERDLLVFHLDSYDFSKLIPRTQPAQEETPRQPQPSSRTPLRGISTPPQPRRAKRRSSLERGRKIKVLMGNRSWEAIYWASEDDNAILAHKAMNGWELTRVDLKRFENSLELGDYLSSREVREIEESLLNNS
jgi:hypothetical protein